MGRNESVSTGIHSKHLLKLTVQLVAAAMQRMTGTLTITRMTHHVMCVAKQRTHQSCVQHRLEIGALIHCSRQNVVVSDR